MELSENCNREGYIQRNLIPRNCDDESNPNFLSDHFRFSTMNALLNSIVCGRRHGIDTVDQLLRRLTIETHTHTRRAASNSKIHDRLVTPIQPNKNKKDQFLTVGRKNNNAERNK